MTFADPDVVRRLLRHETWAVVGLSDDPFRPSYGVAQFLQAHGRRIIPVNPNCIQVLGEKSFPTLADVPEDIDVVDVFRRSEAAGQFVDDAIAVGAKGVWLQLGVVDRAAYDRAAA